jgi:hypothetical protein
LELQNKNAFISTYNWGLDNKIIGYISSRILCASINKKKLFISYMDDWVIRENYDIMDNNNKLFYSHYHNVRNVNSSKIFLFTTGKLKTVIPYCIFNNNLFQINKWNRINKMLPINITCKLINDQMFPILIDIFTDIQNKFKTFIIPPHSNIKNLIKHNIIYPCVCMDKTTPVAIVFYRNCFQKYNNGPIINMIASYCREGYEDIFKDSLTNMVYLLKYKYDFSYLNINDGADNGLLLNYMKGLDIPKLTTRSYYYFYNYISCPVKPSNVFMLN